MAPLDGIRVLDLSRVLAGPFATQILGDLGADIIKIEKPGDGDDTRKWGPPFLKDTAGKDTNESAYYLSANRNKRSVTIDITHPEGQKLIHALAAKSDILIHNFKVGGLEKYGLGFEAMQTAHPHLVYAAISGFGQNGPLAAEPGYDLMAQAMGGLMAHTGPPEGDPMKAGVALVDIMTGLYTVIGALAGLAARSRTGRGQMIDLALLDVTLSSMSNLAQYYLTSGDRPKRFGNAHATIVPYQSFAAADGHLVIAVGNDRQFARFAALLGHPGWATDPAFSSNAARVTNRETLVPMIARVLCGQPVAYWVQALRDLGVPAAAVNAIDDVFADEQVAARAMEIALPHRAATGPIKLVGSPLKFSETPASYRMAPPTLGQHTEEVLTSLLGLDPASIKALRERGVI